MIAIGAVYWLTIAVIVRGETLSLKRKEFIEAAKAGGMGTLAIILRHIVPNTVGAGDRLCEHDGIGRHPR